MKPHLSERAASGCPCGRDHTSPRWRKRAPFRKAEQDLGAKLYEAVLSNTAVRDDVTQRWHVLISGTCETPLAVAASAGNLFATRYVRCRRCEPCLQARRYYWGRAAIEQTRLATEAGRRTWFGTLTLSMDSQKDMLDRARFASNEPNAEYWDDPKCDFRFAAVRRELIVEVRRYWARLRKSGVRFKYFLVFERHKSGLPHMHWLLHEADAPIRKALLQQQWPWGFSNVHIVGGRSKRSAAPEKAAWYVVKYLSKSVQSRQIASKGYRPRLRACRHSEGIRA